MDDAGEASLGRVLLAVVVAGVANSAFAAPRLTIEDWSSEALYARVVAPDGTVSYSCRAPSGVNGHPSCESAGDWYRGGGEYVLLGGTSKVKRLTLQVSGDEEWIRWRLPRSELARGVPGDPRVTLTFPPDRLFAAILHNGLEKPIYWDFHGDVRIESLREGRWEPTGIDFLTDVRLEPLAPGESRPFSWPFSACTRLAPGTYRLAGAYVSTDPQHVTSTAAGKTTWELVTSPPYEHAPGMVIQPCGTEPSEAARTRGVP